MDRTRQIRKLSRRVGQALAYGWRSPAVLVRRLASAAPARDRLLIFDDGFPYICSAFRVAEFNGYLSAFPRAEAFSTGTAIRLMGNHHGFADVLAEYAQRYPELAPRVSRYHPLLDFRGGAAYALFLNNAARFLPVIEKNRLPFVFTLYPGGGFALNNPKSDAKVKRVCASPMLRKIIATMPVTYDYLTQNGYADPSRVEMIFGGVLPVDQIVRPGIRKKRMGEHKDTFDVCFVAFKYTAGGRDKGFDLFVAVARALAARHANVRFHVVGPFDERDGDVGALGDRLRFYGVRPTEWFPEFHAGMDALLFPGSAQVRGLGEFDGFPVVSCIEAGLCGVAVFATDPLNQNRFFKDGQDLVVVPAGRDGIVDRLDHYIRNYAELVRLAEGGRRVFRERYGWEVQMKPRLDILSSVLGVPPAGEAVLA